MAKSEEYIFTREYWTGDSRDGSVVSGDGYHFFKMQPQGFIVEALEMYETEDGLEVVTPLPEMKNVGWIEDLGFDNLDDLDLIEEKEYERIKNLLSKKP